MRRLVAILGLSALAACGSTKDMQSGYAAKWVGKPVDSFALAHGLMPGRQTLSDGRTMIEWSDNYGIGRGGPLADTFVSSIGGAQTQGGSYQLTCKVRMIVGKTGIIEDFAVVADTIGSWQLSRCAEVL